MPAKSDKTQSISQKALALAGMTPWHRLSMAAIAEGAGVPLTTLYHHFPAKQDILLEISREADEAVLKGGIASLSDSPRDRLFDVLMRRFDALAPYRQGIAAIMRDVPAGPAALFRTGPQFSRSMAWMFEAAAIDVNGPLGPLHVAGLGLLYTMVVRVWIKDESADLAATMAELDRRLRQAERVAGWLNRRSMPSVAAQTQKHAAEAEQ